MKINEEKLKKVVSYLYVREVVGKQLYNELNDYPELQTECDKLIDMAIQFEIAILSKTDHSKYKEQTSNQILYIHNIAKNIEKYRKSLLYFDEQGQMVDLF